MKKLLLAALFIVAAVQLRAQQVPGFKSADSLFKKAIGGNLKQRPVVLAVLSPQITFGNTSKTFFESRMPEIVLAGNSKMPVVKLGGYYTMPVKRIGTEEQGGMTFKALPGLPTFA